MKKINTDLLKLFVGKNETLQVLENVCIVGNEVKATDLECYISQKIVNDDIALCVPVNKIHQLTKKLSSYKLSQEGTKIHIHGENMTAELQGIEYTEFVEFPTIEGNVGEVKTKNLLTALETVQFAISEKNFSPVITGVYLKAKDGILKSVGTDSFRLCEYTTQCDSEFEVIIPVTSVKKICKVLKNGGDTCKLTISENMIQIETGNYTVGSVLIQGSFPEYDNEAIMPTEYDYTVKLNTKSLKETLNRLSGISKDINHYVELEGNKLSTNMELDIGQEVIEDSEVEGTPYVVGFNGKYLLGACNLGDYVTLKITGKESPLRIDIDDTIYVIRPLIK